MALDFAFKKYVTLMYWKALVTKKSEVIIKGACIGLSHLPFTLSYWSIKEANKLYMLFSYLDLGRTS